VFSSLRMPSGVAPALLLEPANAALLAAKIFALNAGFTRASGRIQAKAAEKIIQDDSELHG
jgi:5-(carboxyamino)imidazole ribonucleotide mutase/phosphoribosylaminoimidazole-succinocarboxamide synthase